MYRFPQPPIHETPISGILPWVQWFTRVVAYFRVEEPVLPTLGAGWNNFGSGFEDAQYWKDNASGTVHIQGLVQYPTGSPSAGNVIFVLPNGYRPRKILSFTVGTANTSTSHTIGRCDIYPNGNVTYLHGSHNYYFELNGITFRTYE